LSQKVSDMLTNIDSSKSALAESTSSQKTIGQWNLLTGELESPPAPVEVPESGWLFDPDFGFVLPEDVAGRQVIVDEGLSLAFPIGYQATRKPPVRSDGTARSFERRSPANGDRQLYVAQAEDAAQLILSGFGMYLGKKSERLQVKLGGKAVYEFPFFRISEVVVASRGVSLSSDVLKEFCERGIRLSFIEASGRPYAMLSSPVLTATVESRREQLLAYRDERGLNFARLIVRGKIRNQRHLLLYFGKYLKQSDAERFKIVSAFARKLRALELQARRIEGTSVGEKRAELMGLEGVAGRLYWEAVRAIVESKAEFMSRVHQGASDAFNALLNYGYGILYAHVWGAVVNAGLEPFAGYLHVDRPGKPSLVLDMVEEFRQPVVDRTVIAFTNLGQQIAMNDGMLDESTRRTIAQKILERLATRESFHGQQYQVRSIIQMQARSFVSFLRGKGTYKPFSFRW
jgi:CRISPR-associated protein Cas1